MAACDQITFTLRKDRVREKSRLVITARFRDRQTVLAVIPTNVYYRLDCLTTGARILDWTSVTTGQTVSITITPDQNRIQNDCNPYERKQLMVAADYGLSTQFVETIEWYVSNLRGLT